MFGECCFLPGDVKLTMGTGGFWNINTGGNLYASKRGKLVNVCSLNISCYFTAIIDEDTKMDKIRLRFEYGYALPSVFSCRKIAVLYSTGIETKKKKRLSPLSFLVM